jgi:mono/diheme cytochrome c family protein
MARAAEARVLERLFQVSDGPALLLAVQIASDQHLRVSSSAFLRWVRDPELDDGLRVSSFHWLAARGGPEFRLAEVAALSSASDTLFAAGLASILVRDPVHGVAVAERTLARRRAPTAVKQAALRVVSGSDSREARAFVKARWEELVAGRLPPELALEATEAARVTSDAAVRRVALASSSGAPSGAPFSLALKGGDAQRGRALFEEHEAAACLRCHTIDRRGGTTGPDLSVVGTHTRAYLLESLVEPGAHLAPGFESTPMPNMGGLLTLSQLRDLVEYLASRRDQAPDMPLGALSPETVAKGPGCVRVNRSCVGAGGLRVGGRSFVSGVSVASPSRLTYLIPSGFRAFVGSAGLDDAASGRIVEFQAKLDGRLAWNSGPMRQGRLVRFCVPVPEGARRLELIVLDRSASAEASVADWIHVGFLY